MTFRVLLAVALFGPHSLRGQSHARAVVDTVQMQLRWEVAPGKSPVADSLGELSSLAVDRVGNVYVTDFSAVKIWVFDKTGRSLPGIGRKGEGPGECSAPTGLGIGPDGRLYVRDVNRVSRFTLDPATSRLTRYESSFRTPAMSDWRSMRPSRFDSAGRLYYPGFNTIDRSHATGRYYRYTLQGELLDTLVVPSFADAPMSTAFVRTGPHGGRMLHGLNYPPFSPLPVWDITPRGTLLTGAGKTYVLEERDGQGHLVQTYQRALLPDHIPIREREESLAALQARLDSVPVPLERVEGMPSSVRRRQLSSTFPAYMAVYGADDGTVWVRRWPVGIPQRTIFDVFAPNGRLVTVVTLPRAIAIEPQPRLGLDRIIAIGIDPETGANLVLSFGRVGR